MIGILIYHAWLLFQINLVTRNKTVSLKELLQVFAVGATAAIVGNVLIQGIAVRLMGSDFVYYTIGPVAEEVLKIAFVVFLLFFTRLGKTTGIGDGILLAAAAGAGYGFTEDTVRAVGYGLTYMTEGFPAYDLKNIFQLLTIWLPSERTVGAMTSYVYQFVPGHLMWTALVGFGVGVARKFGKKNSLVYLVPVGLLLWVIVDHSLANNSSSWLSFLYPWYGKGTGIRYALTLGIIIAFVLDEILVNRHLPKDEKLLLPGEKKRSLISELWLTLTNWRFGITYWHAMTDYLLVRRQLGYAVHIGEQTEGFITLLQKQRLYMIATARLSGKHKNTGIPAGIAALWYGPQPDFSRYTLQQKVWWLFAIMLIIIGIFNAWLFLFSVYFPESLVRSIYRSPILPILGVIGYGMALFEVIVYYKKKLWRNMEPETDNRIKPYSHPVLINISGLTVIFSMPFFTGTHPLFVDKFLWSQLAKFFEMLKEARKWVGGPVSAGIGAIPIVGNVQSGANAYFGYDYIADEPVEGFDRVMAVLGAVPLVGNAVRSEWLAVKTFRYVKLNKTINMLKKPIAAIEEVGERTSDAIDKIEKAQAVRDHLVEAYGKVRDELQDMTQTQARQLFDKRDNMLKQWSDKGGLKKIDEGHYQMPFRENSVDVYSGKVGTAKLKLGHNLPDTGQISVDHKNQSVMLDTIGKGLPADTKASIADLQKNFPEYTVLHRNSQADGFSVTEVVAPDGTSSTFYSVPTHSRGNVSAVGSR